MSLALPGARHLFSHMQLALATKIKSRVTLSRGVHDALADFRWLLNNIKNHSTQIAELVPLLASAEGHHDPQVQAPAGCGFHQIFSNHETASPGALSCGASGGRRKSLTSS